MIDRERLRELHALGLCDREIGERLGYVETSVKRVRRRMGLPAAISPSERARRMNAARWGESRAPRVAELARTGLGDAAIAALLDTTPKAVASHRFRRGVRAGKAAFARVPSRRDYTHEHMWSVARPRTRKRHIAKHVLDGIRDAFLRGEGRFGDAAGFGELRRIGK